MILLNFTWIKSIRFKSRCFSTESTRPCELNVTWLVLHVVIIALFFGSRCVLTSLPAHSCTCAELNHLVQTSTKLHLVYERFKQVSISCGSTWNTWQNAANQSGDETPGFHINTSYRGNNTTDHILTLLLHKHKQMSHSSDFQLQSAAWIFSRVGIKQEKEASPTPGRMIASVFDVWQTRVWAARFPAQSCSGLSACCPTTASGGDGQRQEGRGSIASYVDAFLILKKTH